MKLSTTLIVLVCFALANGNELPDNSTAPDIPGTTSSPTMPTLLVEPMSSSTTQSPAPLNMTSANDRNMISECFYRRIWDRIAESLLSPEQLFCKRLAANSPNENETFASYRSVWDELVDAELNMSQYTTAMNAWRNSTVIAYINVTEQEKSEIEDCYFYRAWQYAPETIHTSHESYCLRLSTFKPDAMEIKNIGHFITFSHLYETMTNEALADFAHASQCSHVHGKGMQDTICETYSKRIENPSSWRDIRMKELHECKLANYQAPKGHRRKQCLEIIRDYTRIFVQLNH